MNFICRMIYENKPPQFQPQIQLQSHPKNDSSESNSQTDISHKEVKEKEFNETRTIQTIAIESNEEIPRVNSNNDHQDRDESRSTNVSDVREYL